MSLPAFDGGGVLPPGRHNATLADVYERCVADVGDRRRREELFSNLQAFTGRARSVLKSCRLWVGGPFVASVDDSPADIVAVVVPDDWSAYEHLPEEDRPGFWGLLSIPDALSSEWGYLGHVRPFGGSIDSFLLYPGQEGEWHELLSASDYDSALVGAKGYIEIEVR